ncbi:MAG: phytoene desaturase family protein [Gemmatimonadales bacterium]
MNAPRVVVIGAGINGLVAAHYLRRAGCHVTLLERTERAGGACISAEAIIDGRTQSYALGASVLGLMPDFIFRETGLADRLETFVPASAKRVYFPTPSANAWIHRDPRALEQEFRQRWNEHGDVAGFRTDEAKVVAYLQAGYRAGTPPSLDSARASLGETLTRLWIAGSAADLLDHYFTADHTKIYLAMTVTESSPVSLTEPYSAFTLPLMDSGSVFDGYYGFVKPGLWRVTETLAEIDREIGVDIQLGAQVERVDPDRAVVSYSRDGRRHQAPFDHLVLATDPLAAARLVGHDATTAQVETKRFLGSSGKLTLFFKHPVRWKDAPEADADAAFRFIFATESLADFERATLRVTNGGDLPYQPGYIQIYCEGAAMRRLGLSEPFDRLTLFFKNLALGEPGEDLPEVEAEVTRQVLAHIANPEDRAWGRMLTPRDLQRLFLFPGGNIDHTELTGGQTFADRQFAAEPSRRFYQFGRWGNLSYCGAGAYPCGSVAGTPGYMCALELIRSPGW